MSERERTKLGPNLPGWAQACSFNPDEPLWRPEFSCDAPLEYHVAVEAPEGECGECGNEVAFVGCCAPHYLETFRESVRGPDFLDMHEAGPWCGMPGSVWVWSWTDGLGRCEVDDSGEQRAVGRVVLAATPDA